MTRRVIPLLLLAAPSAVATHIQAVNLCKGSMELHIGSHGDPITIEHGAGHSLEIADGSNAAYRYGAAYQATQAEFANVDSSTWFDISIIPSGATGPGSCTSLMDCKAVTGGTGFNVAMQIVPSTGGGANSTESCRVLTCLEDGCDDAYQFPDQDARTHSCSAGVEFQVIFCADDATRTTSDSAVDYWVDASSSKGSFSNSSSGSDTSEQAEATAPAVPQSNPTSAPSSSNGKVTTSTGSGDSSGSSTTVYAATGVAAGVVAIVAAAFVFKRRHAIAFWWGTRNYNKRESSSSDELGFVRVSDDAVI